MANKVVVGVITVIWFCGGIAGYAQTQASNSDAQKGSAMAAHATGTFEVKLTPQPPEDKADGSTLGRMSGENSFTAISKARAKSRC